MFKSAGLAKMFAGRRKFFRGPHVCHLWCRQCKFLKYESVAKLLWRSYHVAKLLATLRRMAKANSLALAVVANSLI